MLLNLDLSSEKHIIFAGDFNLFLDCSLDAKTVFPSLKNNSLSNLFEIIQKIDLCGKWRVWKKKKKKKKMQDTFRQQHFPGLIQGRLDYSFISHNFQEVVKDSEILCAMWTDHSALFCSFQCFSKLKKGSCLWKFNNSLVLNEDFI